MIGLGSDNYSAMQQLALIFCSFRYFTVHWINIFVSIPCQQARWHWVVYHECKRNPEYTFSSFNKQERYDEKRDCRNSLNRWPVGSDGVSLLRWPAAIVSLQAFPSPFSSIFLPPYSQLAKKVATSLPCRSQELSPLQRSWQKMAKDYFFKLRTRK